MTLDASPAEGPTRIVSSDLRRGVRMELIVAPVSFLAPTLVAYYLVDLGLQHGDASYLGLGAIVFLGNVVFDYLMLRTALRFLRQTKPPRASTRER